MTPLVRCVKGFIIKGPNKEIAHRVGPGNCAGCGAGPLHAARPKAGSECVGRCSYEREGLLVCRDCAIGIDLYQKGNSTLCTAAINKIAKEILDARLRGFVTLYKHYRFNQRDKQDQHLQAMQQTETSQSGS